MSNSIFKRGVGSLNLPALFYKLNSNGGKNRIPVYMKTIDGQIRIDYHSSSGSTDPDVPDVPEVTKKVFSGYADWSGSFRNSSGKGTAKSNYSDVDARLRVYQGRYGTYYHLGIMCFKSIFEQVRAYGGTVTNVTLRIKNLHCYSSAGLNTKICGAWNMPNKKPSTFSFDDVKSTAYCTAHFAKGASKTLTLDDNARKNIQNGTMDGFRLLSPTGFKTTDYGYFAGTGSSRPYIEITVEK